MHPNLADKLIGSTGAVAIFAGLELQVHEIARLASAFNGSASAEHGVAVAAVLGVCAVFTEGLLGYTAGMWMAYGHAAMRQEDVAKNTSALEAKPSPV